MRTTISKADYYNRARNVERIKANIGFNQQNSIPMVTAIQSVVAVPVQNVAGPLAAQIASTAVTQIVTNKKIDPIEIIAKTIGIETDLIKAAANNDVATFVVEAAYASVPEKVASTATVITEAAIANQAKRRVEHIVGHLNTNMQSAMSIVNTAAPKLRIVSNSKQCEQLKDFKNRLIWSDKHPGGHRVEKIEQQINSSGCSKI